MRAEASSSRLLAPSVRANGTSAPAASTAASAASKRGSGGSLAPPPLPTYGYGLKRPSATTSSVTSSTGSSSARRRASEEKSRASAASAAASPPKLALHELQSSPPPTSTFLKRGSGRTIATLGNPMVATPPTSQTPVRRTSGSPARQPSTTPTRQRSRHSSVKAETEDQRRSPKVEAKAETQMQPPGFSSPEPYLRQRKRSADMMELQAQLGAFRQEDSSLNHSSALALTNGNAQAKREAEEVDEPPVLTLTEPTTPPRRSSAETNFYGDGLPVSPPDSKRLKRLTRSPKTPLGISTYAPTDGDGLSATQRVRLSLSGYVTVASLTGQAPRRSLGGAEARGLLMSSASVPANASGVTAAQSAFSSETESKSTTPQQARRSTPGSLNQSTSSQKRSKFGASRSQSGPAQVATALLPTKHSVDCLMGYIRELQLSEATLRLQVEKTRKQKHEELSKSMLRVNSLETTMHQIELQRERERNELEEHQQMIQELTSEVMQLREYFARQSQYEQQQPTESHQIQQLYEGEAYAQHPSQPAESYAQPSDAQYGQEAALSSTFESHAMPARAQFASAQTTETNYGYQADQSAHDGAAPEWMDQNADFYGAEYQQYQQGETTNAPAPAEWSDQQQNTYDHSYDYSQEYAAQEYPQQGDAFNDPASYESPLRYASPTFDTAPQPPLSPVASPEAVWNARATAAASAPTIDPPPPMFRIAPRLSDIISPLARSGAAGVNAAVDHNVLKPVTTEVLASSPEERGRKQHRGKDPATTMTPPHPAGSVGPPVFTMGDISSTFEPVPRQPTPPPTSRDSTGYQTPEQPSHQARFDDHVPIPDGPANVEDEQFVPATQFFKPFQKPSPTRHKASVPSPGASPASTKPPLDKLLIDFFTTVDKQKLRMVQGYAKRYKGHEKKLFAELTKRYGAEKVAELQHKFEHGESRPLQTEEPPAAPVEFMAPPPPPSRTRGPVLSPQSLRVDSTSSLSPDIQAPLSPEAGGSGIFAAESPAQPFLMAAESFDDSPSSSHQTELSTVSASPFSPPPKSASPHKVSPNAGRRRGPPLPFSFDEATAESSEDALPVIPPPPLVSVIAPPTMPPRAPAGTAPSTPPRLAPSPPREPPPQSRSPVRNVGIVRQRVSPQSRRQQTESGAGIFPPQLANRGLTPPKPQNGKASPVQPVTLESLLSELYRKHQPDKLKNVPAIVKEYTGKERELVAQLKQTYGALSVKKLELNLETLVQQGGGSVSAPTPAVAPPLATRSTPSSVAPVKKRGWIRRLVGLVIKLVIIRFVILLLALGGLVTVNHFQCGSAIQQSNTTAATSRDCSSLQEGVETFDYTRVFEYVQRVESQQCFCDKWAAQERALWQAPSLASSVELAKLTPFSRTIAEPAFFYFVDTYLPDLPWSVYYETYGKPAIDSTKEYYQVYGKPVVEVGMEYAGIGYVHAKIVWLDVKTRLAELPWSEYYEAYAQPTILVGREYAAEGYGRAKVAYAEISVVVSDLWAQLVEMYNEEGAQVASRNEQPATDQASEETTMSMDDALTKVAMASKALAEPSETDSFEGAQPTEEAVAETESSEDGQGVTPEASGDVQVVLTEPSEDVQADASETLSDVHTETLSHVEATVEVAVEQSDLSLEYASTPAIAVEATETIETPEIVVPQTIDVGETVDAVAPEALAPVVGVVETVDETVSDEDGVAEDVIVDVIQDVENELITEPLEANKDVISEAPAESAEDREVEATNELSEVAGPTQIHTEAVGETEETITSELVPYVAESEVSAVEVADENAPVEAEAVESSPQEDDSVAESAQIPDEVTESESVKAEIEVADEIPQSDSTKDPETTATDITVESDEGAPAEETQVSDEAPLEPVEVGDEAAVGSIPMTEHPVGPSEPESTSDAAIVVDADTYISLTTQQEDETSPEELAVLEDLAGLDPLELLDMADLAAAELVTVQ